MPGQNSTYTRVRNPEATSVCEGNVGLGEPILYGDILLPDSILVNQQIAAEKFFGLSYQPMAVDGFANSLEAESDEDAYRYDDDMDQEIFDGLSGAIDRMNIDLYTPALRGQSHAT